MKIRKLEKTDEEQMLILMEEFWMKHDRGELLLGVIKEVNQLKNPKEQMKIELNQYYDWITYVAEEDNKLLGFASGRVYTEEEHVLDKIGYLEELFVTESARGMRLGRKLVDVVIEELVNQGCAVLRTSAYSNNTIALNLYRGLGFLDESIDLVRKV